MEKENKQNMFNFRKLRKNVKAISPVISVLLMIAVAVVASLVAYAWVMGYIGNTTERASQAIQIQSVANSTTAVGTPKITVYVQNVGEGSVKVISGQSLYINNTLVTLANTQLGGAFDANGNLASQATGSLTATVTATGYTAISHGDVFDIKVTTTSGQFMTTTKVFP
jgi:flagellin-like protein